MASDYEKLYQPAWNAMWGNKKLWVLGALALIDSATGLFRIWLVQLVLLFAQDLSRGDTNPVAQDELSLLGGVLLTIGLIAISIASFAGLISGYDQVYTTGTLSLGKLWNDVRRSFGRLLAIELAWSLVLFLVSGRAISLDWLAQPDWLDWFQCLLGPMVCFGWIASLILSLTVYLANYAVVMDNLNLSDAVQTAWKIIRNFYSAFIPIGILFFFIGWAFVVYQAGMTLLVGIGLGPLSEWNQVLLTVTVTILILIPLVILFCYFVSLFAIIYRQFSNQLSQTESVASTTS